MVVTMKALHVLVTLAHVAGNLAQQFRTVQHGGRVLIKNLYGSDTYLDVCGKAQCGDGTGYQVMTAHSSSRDHLTGTWVIERKRGPGDVVYGDEVHIKNLYGSDTYLDVCGKAQCGGGTGYEVMTAHSSSRDHLTGTWVIEKATGSNHIQQGDQVHIKALP